MTLNTQSLVLEELQSRLLSQRTPLRDLVLQTTIRHSCYHRTDEVSRLLILGDEATCEMQTCEPRKRLEQMMSVQ